MFWGLLALAATGLVPSALLPEWRALETLRAIERDQRDQVTRLEDAVEHEHRMIDAVRSDPAVVFRIAQREFGIPPEPTRTVRVNPVKAPREAAANRPSGQSATVAGMGMGMGTAGAAGAAGATDDAGAVGAAGAAGAAGAVGTAGAARANWVSFLPDLNYDNVFCDPASRRVVVTMSVGLLCVALGLYGRPPARGTVRRPKRRERVLQTVRTMMPGHRGDRHDE